MKVEISTGYVIVKDFITNSADQEYQAALFDGYKMTSKQAKEAVEDAENEISFNPVSVMRAAGERAFAMIERVILVKPGAKPEDAPVEDEIVKSRAWWDELDTRDAKKIKNAVDDIATGASEKAKK